MDCHRILKLLTDFGESTSSTVNDEKLRNISDSVLLTLPLNIVDEIEQNKNLANISNDTGWHYLHLLLYTLIKLSNNEFAEKNAIFTVEQYRIVKTAFEISACIGILPCLLPHIKIHTYTMRSKTFILDFNLNDAIEKYKRLSYTTTVFLELFGKNTFRVAVMSKLDCLLVALLQLSHAPLKKPTDNQTTANISNSDLEMTPLLYQQLKNEQESFYNKLQYVVENCPQSLLIKELMVILSIKNNPKWLQINIKCLLTERIMLPNGITALTLAICNDVSDLGKCWDKLDITAKLVATSHGSDTEKYYNSICPQILDLFHSKENTQAIIIANACMKALHDYNSKVCIEKIINVIMKPLLVKCDSHLKTFAIVKTEEEVSHCIENLYQLFLTTNAEFKCLPLSLLLPISLPLFYLYVKSYKSIYVLRNQVRQLILKMLTDETTREMLFAVFLNHEITNTCEYGEKLNFSFGINGALEITSKSEPIDYEEITDCLFNIVEKDENFAFSLFRYLLKVLPNMNNATENVRKGKLLEMPQDLEERIMKQIFAVKLLTLCSNSTLVQQAVLKNPEPFLNLINFFFSKTIANFGNEDCVMHEQDANTLYTSLLFIKMIITDCNVQKTWETFQNFTSTIKKEFDLKKVPAHVFSLIDEIEAIVKKKGKSISNYCDLTADNKKMNEFDKALVDLVDPLLPVRGHGIITLTKLIESRHPETTLKKDLLLCIFQENLDHEDSFIYLAAINGLCALSSMFPEKVLEILVHEFIGLTQQLKNRDVTPETRAKLGEILVKTTRSLGEVAPKYKSLLVNGFLCGTRDPDALVRASSLSCLGELCKIMGFRLGTLIIEILYCIGCIIKTDKDDSCRRAGVLVATLLLRGLGKDTLTELGENLVTLYRSLKYLRDNDKDVVLQLHAQLALEEFDDIVQQFLFAKPKLEKSIFLLSD
ncbi:transport and Golgi organization protein 6 homolog [Phymastichus coffea]|uniref:transport and Golgi organization protein 6 homolog n=1 Tax=Phymastichus coffea TaxID=108790 RepID=UPI00273CB575|nr:transport and Golgi organization protein 6 homolog [Phymastichus coffea]